MKRDEQPFVVGRRTRRGTTVVLLRSPHHPVFPGPWTLRALVTSPEEKAA